MTTFVEPRTAKQYECGICSLVMTEPRQFNCTKGDLFCKECVMTLKITVGFRQCPLCREECALLLEYVKIPFIERQIRELKVLCQNRVIHRKTLLSPKTNEVFAAVPNNAKKRKIITTDGDQNKCIKLNVLCDWSDTYAELEQHRKVCQFAPVKCDHCGNEMFRKELSAHVKECTYVMIKCKCAQSFKRMLMEWHINNYCTETVIDCTQCGLRVKRGSISEHKKSECEEAMVECRFVEYGCNAKVKRKDLDTHSEESMSQHLDMVKDTCDDLKDSHRKSESRCDEYGEKIEMLMAQISSSAPEIPIVIGSDVQQNINSMQGKGPPKSNGFFRQLPDNPWNDKYFQG